MNDATLDTLRRVLFGGGGRADTSDVDWPFVHGFVLHHGLAGLALTSHRSTPGGVLPPETEAALTPYRVTTGLGTRVRLETGQRARAALSEAGLPSLVFKGGALMRDGTYTDPGERVLEDVDLLVHPRDADAAVGALQAAGFRGWTSWERSRTRWLSAFTLDDPTTPPDVPGTVDLHWSSLYGSLRLTGAVSTDPLWDGADVDSGLPPVEGHFVLLTDHFFKHLRVVRHLRGLVDLARLAPRLHDTDALLRHAKAREAEGRLTRMLRVLHHMYGAVVEPEILERTNAARPPDPVERRYLSPRRLLGAFPHRPGRVAGLIMRWRLDGGVAGGLREVGHVLAPPADWLQERYPGANRGALTLRARYTTALVAWLAGLGPSPLSPNQEAADPAPHRTRSS